MIIQLLLIFVYWITSRLLIIADHIIIEGKDPCYATSGVSDLTWMLIPISGDIILVCKLLANIQYLFLYPIEFFTKIRAKIEINSKKRDIAEKIRIKRDETAIKMLEKELLCSDFDEAT